MLLSSLSYSIEALSKRAGKGEPIMFETDVLVVGSGAGGGIIGKIKTSYNTAWTD